MRSIPCKSCAGEGRIVCPATDLLNGNVLPAKTAVCPSCGGSGSFKITEDGSIEYVELSNDRPRQD